MSFEGKPPKERTWVAQVKKAPKDLANIWGYWYILTIRQHLVHDKTPEQIVALIYHELRHVGPYGEIIQHDIEDWACIVETLGKDWFERFDMADDILAGNFEWDGRHSVQLSLAHTAEYQEAAKSTRN